MMRKTPIPIAGIAGTVTALALICAVAASDTASRSDAVNDRLQFYVDHGFDSLQSMVKEFQWMQKDVIPLVPPCEPYMLFDQGLRYAKWSGFPTDFVSGLVGVLQDGVAVYPVVCFEDPNTRQYVFLNAEGTEFYRIAPPAGYDPHWILFTFLPNVYNEGRSAEEIRELEWQYDPARIVVKYTLIGKQELHDLLLAQAKAESRKPKKSGEMALMMLGQGSGGPNITNLAFTAMQALTNGSIYLEISYPTNFTNNVDIFSVDGGTGLIEGWWNLRVTTNINTSTNYITWTDTTASNIMVRFYVAAKADTNSVTDPDGDGLTWGREKYLYKTCPTNSDSDGDGLSDYYEVMTSHTDPNNPDTNKPMVTISFPTNNFKWVWMP